MGVPDRRQGTFRSVVTSRDWAPGAARGYILYAASDNTWEFWLGNGDWGIRGAGPAIVLNQWYYLVGDLRRDDRSSPVRERRVVGSTGAGLPAEQRSGRCGIATGATDRVLRSTSCPGASRRGRGLQLARLSVRPASKRTTRRGLRVEAAETSLRPPSSAASPTSGRVPLTVNFNGQPPRSDPDGTIASYAWDLDGDGAFDDSSAVDAVLSR